MSNEVAGREHWTHKGEVRLFLWEKFVGAPDGKPAVLFVHGSSMASQPTFDLAVPDRPDSSVMDWFARRGFVCWTVDMEGYGRSDKTRDAFVWTGEGAPTLEQRRKKLPEFLATKRRPIDRAFVRSIFARDHPDCAEPRVVEAFADAILALDDSMPNGTYIDMCSKLPVVDPAKIIVPTLVLRGQYDGIAAMDDLVEFWKRLPNPDKQFTVMAGISHASFQQKNYVMVYHILHAYFTQPVPVYA